MTDRYQGQPPHQRDHRQLQQKLPPSPPDRRGVWQSSVQGFRPLGSAWGRVGPDTPYASWRPRRGERQPPQLGCERREVARAPANSARRSRALLNRDLSDCGPRPAHQDVEQDVITRRNERRVCHDLATTNKYAAKYAAKRIITHTRAQEETMDKRIGDMEA